MAHLGRLRTSAATWGGAAWLVLQQFGVPAASPVSRETRVVRVEDAERLLAASELLPDGRILTVPMDVDPERLRQDGRKENTSGVVLN